MKFSSVLFCFFCVLPVFFFLKSETPDIIVFSFNRPLQLEAFLASLSTYARGVGTIAVIYRSDKSYQESYDKLAAMYKTARFIRQSTQDPQGDFKSLTLKAFADSPSDYILFAVDDLIFKDHVDLQKCTAWLKKTGAYAFYLRLGTHISYCFTMQSSSRVASLNALDTDIYTWQFKAGTGDWGYQNSLDGTIFVKRKIADPLKLLSYSSPNTLEGLWSGCVDTSLYGLCYRSSKVVNLVLNIVQKDFRNSEINNQYAHKRYWEPAYLLKKFKSGYRLNFAKFYQISNKSPHVGNCKLEFIKQ